eukprot:TRINITY_DN2063_c0_g1_i6.p1 TRINITY_DN2063_c0_g1~~TRINITY_DN2063_c0_g1_i6.p1  ORF type:complete len:200 (+),score=13.58 TRINITY_DN2063_c0_g1_i6:85-600(+)
MFIRDRYQRRVRGRSTAMLDGEVLAHAPGANIEQLDRLAGVRAKVGFPVTVDPEDREAAALVEHRRFTLELALSGDKLDFTLARWACLPGRWGGSDDRAVRLYEGHLCRDEVPGLDDNSGCTAGICRNRDDSIQVNWVQAWSIVCHGGAGVPGGVGCTFHSRDRHMSPVAA